MPILLPRRVNWSVPSGIDLFSGAGGCSVGYARAGIQMIGFDWKAQPHYPFEFVRADIRFYLDKLDWLSQWDFIHASPPCQEHTRLRTLATGQGYNKKYLNLIPAVRETLEEWAYQTGGIYVIENVPRAPIRNDVTLCGTQFSLEWNGRQLQRHRWFESNLKFWRHGCKHSGKPPWGVYGSLDHKIQRGGHTPPNLDAARKLMGIDWMTWRELREAIPPAYTEFLGEQVIDALNGFRQCEVDMTGESAHA